MAVNKKNIMTRYFFVVLVMGLLGIAIVVKAAVIMFAERQYWQAKRITTAARAGIAGN